GVAGEGVFRGRDRHRGSSGLVAVVVAGDRGGVSVGADPAGTRGEVPFGDGVECPAGQFRAGRTVLVGFRTPAEPVVDVGQDAPAGLGGGEYLLQLVVRLDGRTGARVVDWGEPPAQVVGAPPGVARRVDDGLQLPGRRVCVAGGVVAAAGGAAGVLTQLH